MSSRRRPSMHNMVAIQHGIYRGDMRASLDSLMLHYRVQIGNKKPGPYLKAYLSLLQAMYANLDALKAMIDDDGNNDFVVGSHLAASAHYASMAQRLYKNGKIISKYISVTPTPAV